MWQRSRLLSERAPTPPCAMPTKLASPTARGRLRTLRGLAGASFPNAHPRPLASCEYEYRACDVRLGQKQTFNDVWVMSAFTPKSGHSHFQFPGERLAIILTT